MPQSPFGQHAVHQQVFGLVDFQNGEQESQSGSDKKRRNRLLYIHKDPIALIIMLSDKDIQILR